VQGVQDRAVKGSLAAEKFLGVFEATRDLIENREVAELENTDERLDEAGRLGRFDEVLLDLFVRQVVTEGDLGGDEGAGQADDSDRRRGDKEIRQGHQIAALVLNLGVKEPLLGDPPQELVNSDEVAAFEVADNPQHQPRHGVGCEGRRGQGNGGGERNPEERDEIGAS